MKMVAQVTVTAERRGGASAVSRGWRWLRSHCAGEEEDSLSALHFYFKTKYIQVTCSQRKEKYSDIQVKVPIL